MDGKSLGMLLLVAMVLLVLYWLYVKNPFYTGIKTLRPGIDTRGMSMEERIQYAKDHNLIVPV